MKQSRRTLPLEGIHLNFFLWIRTDTGENGSGAYTTRDGDRLFVDSSGGPITVNLHASPLEGDSIKIYDTKGKFNTNALTVDSGAELLDGNSVTTTIALSTQNTYGEFIFMGGADGWVYLDHTIPAIAGEKEFTSRDTIEAGKPVVVNDDGTVSQSSFGYARSTYWTIVQNPGSFTIGNVVNISDTEYAVIYNLGATTYVKFYEEVGGFPSVTQTLTISDSWGAKGLYIPSSGIILLTYCAIGYIPRLATLSKTTTWNFNPGVVNNVLTSYVTSVIPHVAINTTGEIITVDPTGSTRKYSYVTIGAGPTYTITQSTPVVLPSTVDYASAIYAEDSTFLINHHNLNGGSASGGIIRVTTPETYDPSIYVNTVATRISKVGNNYFFFGTGGYLVTDSSFIGVSSGNSLDYSIFQMKDKFVAFRNGQYAQVRFVSGLIELGPFSIDVDGPTFSQTVAGDGEFFTFLDNGNAAVLLPMEFGTVDGQELIGIAAETVTDAATVRVKTNGGYYSAYTGLTPGKAVYETHGVLNQTSGNRVGLALTATEMYIDIGSGASGGISGSVIDNAIVDSSLVTTTGRYIVPSVGTIGDFISQENKYADFNGTTFIFTDPLAGDSVMITSGENSGEVWSFDGAEWIKDTETTGLPIYNYDAAKEYKVGNIVLKDSVLYQANGNIPANTVFAIGTTGITWKQIQSQYLPGGFMQVKATSQQTGVVANTTIMFQSTLTQSGTDISLNTSTGEFTLKAGKTYRLTGVVPWIANGFGQFQWHNGTAYIGSTGHQELVTGGGAYGGGTAVSIAYITPSVDTKVTLKAVRVGATLTVNDSVAGAASATANIEVVSASNIVSTGHITTHASVSINHNITAINTDITGVTVTSAGITNSNGQFTLVAGNTYQFNTFLTVDSRGKTNSTSDVAIQWVDATTNVAINAMGLTTIAINYTESMARNGSGTFTYTPTTNQTVKMRVTYTGGTTTLSGTASIVQLGTSNVSQFVGTLTNEYNVGYTYPKGTIVLKDGHMYQSNSVIAPNTAFSVGTTDGTWMQIGSGGSINENGKLTIPAQTTAGLSNTWADLTGGSFVLPSAGTWNISYSVIATVANDNWAASGIFDSNNNIIEGSGNTMGTWNGTPFQLDKTFPITVTGPTTLKVRVKTYSNVAVTTYNNEPTNVASGHSVVSWTKTSGYIPSVGQSTNYATLIRTTGVQSISAPSDLIFNTTGAKTADIDYNTTTGVATLRAGITYELSTSITFGGFTDASTGWVQYSWVDATTNATLSGTASAVAFAVNRNTSENNSASAGGIYTPTTNQTVKLRVTSINGTAEMRGSSQGYATIKQLGTTSTAQFTGMLSNEYNVLNTYPKGTIVVKEGFIYQANEIIPAGTLFATGDTGMTWKILNLHQSEAGEHTGITSGSFKSDSTFATVPGSVFTIPTAGTWEVEYSASVSNAGQYATFFRLADNTTGIAVPNSSSVGGQGPYGSGQSIADIDGSAFITTTGATTLRLEWAVGGGNSTIFNNYTESATATNTSGDSVIRWKKISGFLPVQTSALNMLNNRPNITYVSTNGSNTLALVADGKIYTTTGTASVLGNYTNGRGGNDASPFFGLENFKEVAIQTSEILLKTGGYNEGVAFALYANGDLYTWGRNNTGQCGVGSNSAVVVPTLAATNVVDVYTHPTNAEYSIVDNRLFIKKSDGYIYGTGYNGYGALGLGDTTNRNVFTKITALGTNVKSLWNMGSSYGCTIVQKDDNTIWVAGYNGYGQLGTGNQTNQSSFVQTTLWADTTYNLKKVIGGYGYYSSGANAYSVTGMLFTKVSDGSTLFKTAGANNWKSLGDGTTTLRSTPVTPNVGTGKISDIAGNGGGPLSVSVLKENGDLYAFGYNEVGMLGDGTLVNIGTPAIVQTQVLKILNNGNGGHTYSYRGQSAILKADGLYMTGSNLWGECGNGVYVDMKTYTKALLPKGFVLKHLGCYTTNASVMTYLAVGEDNSLYGWGYNAYNGLTGGSTVANGVVPAQFKLQV